MREIPIVGAGPKFEKEVRTALRVLPSWLVQGGRISRVSVTRDPVVVEQVSMYQHGTRALLVTDGLATTALRQSMSHELGHGIDDLLHVPGYDHPHYFSSTDVWFKLHRGQSSFEFPKYAEKPLEYFADCVAKFCLLGKDRFSLTHPRETTYIESWVLPITNQILAQR